VTGQSAQGKTLPKILANLHEGGFAAYMAASRASDRYGLCITEPVTLTHLNKPVPYNLLMEQKRFDGLEHNTYVRYGFLQGHAVNVIDLESERQHTNTKFVANFKLPVSNNGKKRKHPSSPEHMHDSKKMRLENAFPPPRHTHFKHAHKNIPESHLPPSSGCIWSAENWSCAYDSTLMTVLYAYMTLDAEIRLHWMAESPLNGILAHSFNTLLSSCKKLKSATEIDAVREKLHDYLSNHDSIHFPRHGPHGAPAELIFTYLQRSNSKAISLCYSCDSSIPCSPHIYVPLQQDLPTIFCTTFWNAWSSNALFHIPNQTSASVQSWIDLALASRARHLQSTPSDMPCDGPCLSVCRSRMFLTGPPSMLVMEVIPDTCPKVIPSAKIFLPVRDGVLTYSIRGVIYLGQFHFTARMIHSDGNIWSYDGQKNHGIPWLDDNCRSMQTPAHVTALMEFDNHSAHLYIYTQDTYRGHPETCPSLW
jgi:hypothetical protein